MNGKWHIRTNRNGVLVSPAKRVQAIRGGPLSQVDPTGATTRSFVTLTSFVEGPSGIGDAPNVPTICWVGNAISHSEHAAFTCAPVAPCNA